MGWGRIKHTENEHSTNSHNNTLRQTTATLFLQTKKQRNYKASRQLINIKQVFKHSSSLIAEYSARTLKKATCLSQIKKKRKGEGNDDKSENERQRTRNVSDRRK